MIVASAPSLPACTTSTASAAASLTRDQPRGLTSAVPRARAPGAPSPRSTPDAALTSSPRRAPHVHAQQPNPGDCIRRLPGHPDRRALRRVLGRIIKNVHQYPDDTTCLALHDEACHTLHLDVPAGVAALDLALACRIWATGSTAWQSTTKAPASMRLTSKSSSTSFFSRFAVTTTRFTIARRARLLALLACRLGRTGTPDIVMAPSRPSHQFGFPPLLDLPRLAAARLP